MYIQDSHCIIPARLLHTFNLFIAEDRLLKEAARNVHLGETRKHLHSNSSGNNDHRLIPSLVDSISAALHRIRSEAIATPSTAAALITTGEGNYFSNDHDISWVESSKDKVLLLMMSKIRSLLTELMSLPMPTIAAVNGQATGTGFMLALSHDYVFMRKDSGFLHIGGLDNKTIIPTLFFRAKLKAKISSPAVWIDIVLKAEKMTAENAIEKGIVDAVYDTVEETVAAAVELGEQLVRRNWNGKCYVENRKFLSNVVFHELSIVGNCFKLMPKHCHELIKGADHQSRL